MSLGLSSSKLAFLLFLLLPVNTFLAQIPDPAQTAEAILAEGEILFAKNTPEDRELAFPKFLESLKLSESAGDTEMRLKALNRLNDISFYRNDFKSCIGFSQQILELAKLKSDRALEGRTLGNIGFYKHRLGDNSDGLGYLNRAGEILRQLGEKQSESVVLSNTGLVFYDMGRVKAALELFRQSLTLKRETKDRRGEAILLANLGYVANETGDKNQALEYYRQASDIARESKDSITQAILLSNIGSVFQDFADYENAFDYYEESLSINRRIGEKYGEAVVLQNFASLFRALGDLDAALTLTESALGIYEKGGFRRAQTGALSSAGNLHKLKKEPDLALAMMNRALDLQKQLDNKSGFSQIYGDIGTVLLEKGDFKLAHENFERALKYATETDEAFAIAYSNQQLGRTSAQLLKPEAAAQYFELAIDGNRKTATPERLAESLYHSAVFEEERGNVAIATARIAEAVRIVETVRSSIISQNFQAKFFGEQQRYYELYIRLLVSQYKKDPAGDAGAKALLASEQARARSLLDSLGENRRSLSASISPDLADEDSLARREIREKELERAEALKKNDLKKAAEIERELADSFRRFDSVQAKIKLANPQIASMSNPDPLGLDGIRKQVLDDDSVLLEYFLGEEGSFLFVVDKQGLTIVNLPPRAVVESLVRDAMTSMKSRSLEVSGETARARTVRIARSDADTQKRFTDAGEVLIAPILEKIDGKRLLVVPSGILQYLPFSALIVRDQKTIPPRKGQPVSTKYLIESNEVVILPSASVVPLLRELKRDTVDEKSITVIADPVFSNEDPRIRNPDRPKPKSDGMAEAFVRPVNLRSDFSRLRFSRIEAENIVSLGAENKSRLALDFFASVEFAGSELTKKSSIIHFATHGRIDSRFPELSSIVLSLVDEKGQPRDGFLRLHDIYGFRLDADLVVLSACETAIGSEIKGEGLIGLTRGFMFAGSPRVIASLWRIDDRATADLMRRFYQRLLKEKLRASASLRQAQLSMLREKSSAHPFFWAGFMLQGEWR